MVPTTPSDPPLQVLPLTTGPLSFTDEGEGVVVIAVHGVPGSSRDFRWLATGLGPGVRLVRLDHPGFGGTPVRTGGGLSFAERGDLVVSAMDALAIDHAVIIGHSMGGGVACAAAARHPDRFDGLVLLSSVGLRIHRGLRQLRGRAVAGQALRLPPVRWLLMGRIRRMFWRAGWSARTSDAAMVRAIRLAGALSFDEHRRHVAAVSQPTFLAYACDDALIERDVFEELAAAVPAGPRHVFENGGHNVQKSHAVELGEAIAGWAMTLGGGADQGVSRGDAECVVSPLSTVPSSGRRAD